MAAGSVDTKSISHEAKLALWNDSMAEDVQKLVKNEFPRKVLELDAFYKSEFFEEKWLEKMKKEFFIPPPRQSVPNDQVINHETRGKKRKHVEQEGHDEVNHRPNETIPSNQKIKDLIALMKPKIKQLIDDTNMIRQWIIIMVPKIEDGNNFGVSVQEDILEEVRAVEAEAAVYYDEIPKYHNSRAKIVSKVTKYPQIEDYRDTLQEIDEKQWLHMKLVVKELRNHHNTLYDMIIKNWEKLICPRSSNTDTMF